MMKKMQWMWGVVALACAGCGTEVVTEAPEHDVAAPAIGKADGRDRADSRCTVVLRDMARPPNGRGGWETEGTHWIWRGHVDVRTDAVGPDATVKVLYSSASNSGHPWFEVNATPTGERAGGYARYVFAISQKTFGPGMSGLEKLWIDVVPFVEDGRGRLFDHNRAHGDFANQRAEVGDGWEVHGNPNVCPRWEEARPGQAEEVLPPAAELVFASNFHNSQQGAIVEGAPVSIWFDIDRLGGCRNTHNGHPAWGTDAHVIFHPGGEEVQASILEFPAPQGTPLNAAVERPAQFDVPMGATSMEVWFRNWSGAGSQCESFDSNDSANYRFEVQAQADWVGDAVANFAAGGGHPCEGAEVELEEGFYFDDDARRYPRTNTCLQVWKPGVTDTDNAELWKQLDVRMYYRIGDLPWQMRWFDFVDRTGDNARFAFDVQQFDPLVGSCPNVQPEFDGERVWVEGEFYFTVNSVVVQPRDKTNHRAVWETTRAAWDANNRGCGR
jgi:hypothetical protein